MSISSAESVRKMPAVVFQDVSKRFVVHHERPRSFLELAVNLFRDGEREELWALKNVSFSVERGETLGLIGYNGSGKSTALKLMSRILEPTSGQVRTEGRISALIELGAGFHPDLTGRENVFLNGSLLGFSRSEMEARYDEIVAFSELGRFIDMPLKHYSSGMQMRLGFAIATSVDPDILLIDEVLAVGDEGFQRKCLARINRSRGRDKAIVFVSHELGAVREICDRVIWLEDGVVMAEGPAHDVVAQYLVRVGEHEEAGMAAADAPQINAQGDAGQSDEEKRWGTGEAVITNVRLAAGRHRERRVFDTEDSMIIDVEYQARQFIDEAAFGVGLFRDDGTHCYGTNTGIEGHLLALDPGRGRVRLVLDRLALLPGTYTVDVALHAPNGHPYDYWREARSFSARSSLDDVGVYRPRHRWVVDGALLDDEGHEDVAGGRQSETVVPEV